VYDGLDLPDSAFAGEPAPRPGAARRWTVRWYWLAAGFILLAGMILGALARW